MRTRRPATLLAVALLVLGVAIPAAADRPAPSVGTPEVFELSSWCAVIVPIAVPKGGKRVMTVTVGDESWSDSGAFLNGSSATVGLTVPPGTDHVVVTMLDAKGDTVYVESPSLTCEPEAPSPQAY